MVLTVNVDQKNRMCYLAVVYSRGLSVMLYQFIYVSLNVISRPPLFCVLYYYFFMCVTVSIALLYAH